MNKFSIGDIIQINGCGNDVKTHIPVPDGEYKVNAIQDDGTTNIQRKDNNNTKFRVNLTSCRRVVNLNGARPQNNTVIHPFHNQTPNTPDHLDDKNIDKFKELKIAYKINKLTNIKDDAALNKLKIEFIKDTEQLKKLQEHENKIEKINKKYKNKDDLDYRIEIAEENVRFNKNSNDIDKYILNYILLDKQYKLDAFKRDKDDDDSKEFKYLYQMYELELDLENIEFKYIVEKQNLVKQNLELTVLLKEQLELYEKTSLINKKKEIFNQIVSNEKTKIENQYKIINLEEIEQIESLTLERKYLQLKTELDILKNDIHVSSTEFKLIYDITNSKLKNEILTTEKVTIEYIIRLLKKVQSEDIKDLETKIKDALKDEKEAKLLYDNDITNDVNKKDWEDKKEIRENISELIVAKSVVPILQFEIKKKELQKTPIIPYFFAKPSSPQVKIETNKIIEKEIIILEKKKKDLEKKIKDLEKSIASFEQQQKRIHNPLIPFWYTAFPMKEEKLIVTTPQKIEEAEINRIAKEKKAKEQREKKQKQIEDDKIAKEEREKKQKKLQEKEKQEEEEYFEKRKILIEKEKERIKLHNEQVDKVKDEYIKNFLHKPKNAFLKEGKKLGLKGKELGKFIAQEMKTRKQKPITPQNKTKKVSPINLFSSTIKKPFSSPTTKKPFSSTTTIKPSSPTKKPFSSTTTKVASPNATPEKNVTKKCPPRCATGTRCHYISKHNPVGICIKK
jgi:hypothetical protein